jgi:hypothetical protein
MIWTGQVSRKLDFRENAVRLQSFDSSVKKPLFACSSYSCNRSIVSRSKSETGHFTVETLYDVMQWEDTGSLHDSLGGGGRVQPHRLSSNRSKGSEKFFAILMMGFVAIARCTERLFSRSVYLFGPGRHALKDKFPV